MKSHLFTFSILFSALQMNSAESLLKTQLLEVNRQWAFHSVSAAKQNEEFSFSSDRELIQTHLQLVEDNLRHNAPRLSHDQLKKRQKMLDVLHEYWVKGLFPKNTGHNIRTPYFIDIHGTACAVGHLIIRSGSEELANRISVEDNNAYIFDLVKKYPEIKDWALVNGFTIEELAWIQPCYNGPIDTAGFKHPRCHNAMNGYFHPDLSQLQGPLQKSFYRLEPSGWIIWQSICGHWLFNALKAGIYKWEVKDALNTVHTYTTEMIAPAAASVSISESGNFNSCNGTISVSMQGGVLPYRYIWSEKTETTSILAQVCEEVITLTAFESGYGCYQNFTLDTRPVGTLEKNIQHFEISPNPVSDILRLKREHRGTIKIDIYDNTGRLAVTAIVENNEAELNVSALPKGLYFLRAEGYRIERVVKE